MNQNNNNFRPVSLCLLQYKKNGDGIQVWSSLPLAPSLSLSHSYSSTSAFLHSKSLPFMNYTHTQLNELWLLLGVIFVVDVVACGRRELSAVNKIGAFRAGWFFVFSVCFASLSENHLLYSIQLLIIREGKEKEQQQQLTINGMCNFWILIFETPFAGYGFMP